MRASKPETHLVAASAPHLTPTDDKTLTNTLDGFGRGSPPPMI